LDAFVWPDEKGGFQISPDRNRALALLAGVIVLAIAIGFGLYRVHRPMTSATKQAAPVMPVVRSWAPATIVVKSDPPGATGSSVPLSVAPDDPGESQIYQLTPEQEARWPVKGPEPLPGALLPEHLIVAYYGNPKSQKMGILGQLPAEEMLPRLEAAATDWARADRGRKVLPALNMVVTVVQGKPPETDDQRKGRVARVRERLRSLLSDRFGFRAHFEQRERTVLRLRIAKGGPRLLEDANPQGRVSTLDGHIQGYGAPLSMLATQLSMATGLIVHDETGLGGKYDFVLDWALDNADPSDTRPSIFTAVSQLGLRLERANGPVNILVIDHVERPSAN